MRRVLSILGRDPLWAFAVVAFMAAVALYIVLSSGRDVAQPAGLTGPTGSSGPPALIIAPPGTPLPAAVARRRTGASRSPSTRVGAPSTAPASTRPSGRAPRPAHRAPKATKRKRRRVAPPTSSPSRPPSSPPPQPTRPLTVTVPAPVTVCTPVAAVNPCN